MSRVARNAPKDIMAAVEGAKGLANAAADVPAAVLDRVAMGDFKGLGEDILSGAEKGAQMLTAAPQAVLDRAGEIVSNPKEAFAEHPVNTLLDVGSVALPLLKGLRGTGAASKAATLAGFEDAASLADDAARASKAAKVAPVAEDLAKALPDVSQETMGRAAPATFEEAMGIPERPVGGSKPPIEPPTPGAGAGSAPPGGPLDEVKAYINAKYGKAAEKPGFGTRAAKYLKNEVADLRAKDLGLQSGQIRQMGEGFQGLEKAEALMDYANSQGYFKPSLTDMARKELIKKNMEQAGKTVGAIRDIASKRASPPLDQMYQTVKAQLTDKYGIKAPGQVKEVLSIIEKEMQKNPTFSGVADISTDLNKELRNIRSMGRHQGPNTDAADILSRMNNDAIRSHLNPKEATLYTDSLRDFGAHKKLEKAVAGAGRRAMAARSNQRGILGRLWQEALDRGGYRIASNTLDRTADAFLKNPEKASSLPSFFEELAHQADDVLDDVVEGQGMAHGGIVNGEMEDFLESKYGGKRK